MARLEPDQVNAKAESSEATASPEPATEPATGTTANSEPSQGVPEPSTETPAETPASLDFGDSDPKPETQERVLPAAEMAEQISKNKHFSDNFKGKLKEAGYNAAEIQAFEAGAKAQAQTIALRFQDAVGGRENMTRILNWAKETQSKESIARIKRLTSDPDGEVASMAARDLMRQYQEANPSNERRTTHLHGVGSAPEVAYQGGPIDPAGLFQETQNSQYGGASTNAQRYTDQVDQKAESIADDMGFRIGLR